MPVNRALCFLSSDRYLSKLAVGIFLILAYKKVRKGWTSSSMDPQRPEEQTGGLQVRVSDCYIWAAIYYLDSPSDYRECLPYSRQRIATPSGYLVMLGDKRPSPWITGIKITIGAVFACKVLLLIMRACL